MAKETAKGWEEGVPLTSGRPRAATGREQPPSPGCSPWQAGLSVLPFGSHLGQWGHTFAIEPSPLPRPRPSPHSRAAAPLLAHGAQAQQHPTQVTALTPSPTAGQVWRTKSHRRSSAAASPGGSPQLQLSTVTPHLPAKIRETAAI